MLKLIVTCCIVTFFANISQAQTATGNTGSMIQLKDANGQILVVGEDNKSVNTWLLKKFSKGDLVFTDGKNSSDTSMNYSMLTGELCFMYEGLLYKVSKPVKKFSLTAASENGSEQIRQFENGFPAIDKNTNTTFYEVIFEGTKWIVLKYWYMQPRESTAYGGTTEKTFVTLTDYYLFNQSSNTLQFLGDRLTIKKIAKLMPELQSAIMQWVEKNPSAMKTDADFIKLLNDVGGKP
ncbi:MAG: hypothetical protein FGM61_08350 [Sediminibacterium sp.]|nr:hypothetical protein [Sediminibacterium sp.]